MENTKLFAKKCHRCSATASLQEVIKELNKFGTWQIPWGSINRFQRQTVL
jgi:hypothetical protein